MLSLLRKDYILVLSSEEDDFLGILPTKTLRPTVLARGEEPEDIAALYFEPFMVLCAQKVMTIMGITDSHDDSQESFRCLGILTG